MKSSKEVLDSLTAEEKIRLLSGGSYFTTAAIPEKGVYPVLMANGPTGVCYECEDENDEESPTGKKMYPSTLMPSIMNLACTFDRKLAYDYGKAIGEQCRALSVALLLAPGINIKRSPLCGRNFEYFSEDPYLVSRLGAEYVKGLQSCGAGACVKHFACNNREFRRFVSNSVVDKRALREIYLYAFEYIVKNAKPAAIMPSYNLVNGEYSCENSYLLEQLLRREWGFEGVAVSDWGAISDRIKALKAGCDIEMPYSETVNEKELLKALEYGEISQDDIDKCVLRILNFVLNSYPHKKPKEGIPKDILEEAHRKAVEIASDSMVLLKNEGGFFPLKGDEEVVFAGHFLFEPQIQGAGSAYVKPAVLSDLTGGLQKAFPKARLFKAFDKWGYKERDFEKFCEAARSAEKVILFLGFLEHWDTEGYDRFDIDLAEGLREIYRAVKSLNPNTAAVLCGGGVKNIAFLSDAGAILETFLAGEGYGEALPLILSGKISPSGRLAETIPCRLEDTPSYLSMSFDGKEVFYGESIFVGYRYYNAKNIKTLYPFGFGLSYTHFEYSDLELEAEGRKAVLEFSLENAGAYDAKETVLIFYEKKDSEIIRAGRQLRV